MSQQTRPRIVIVGAGFGGLSAAKALASAPAEIVLIDRNNYHLFQPLLYQVATAGLSPADIAAPIRGILRRQANARVVLARHEHGERAARGEAHDRHAIRVEIARGTARTPEREGAARVREGLVEASTAADEAVVDRGHRHARVRESRADEAHGLHVARAEDEAAAVHEEHRPRARAPRGHVDVEPRRDAARVALAIAHATLAGRTLVLDRTAQRPQRFDDRTVSEPARFGHQRTVHNRALPDQPRSK